MVLGDDLLGEDVGTDPVLGKEGGHGRSGLVPAGAGGRGVAQNLDECHFEGGEPALPPGKRTGSETYAVQWSGDDAGDGHLDSGRHLRGEAEHLRRAGSGRASAGPGDGQGDIKCRDAGHAEAGHGASPVEAVADLDQLPFGGQAPQGGLHRTRRSPEVGLPEEGAAGRPGDPLPDIAGHGALDRRSLHARNVSCKARISCRGPAFVVVARRGSAPDGGIVLQRDVVAVRIVDLGSERCEVTPGRQRGAPQGARLGRFPLKVVGPAIQDWGGGASPTMARSATFGTRTRRPSRIVFNSPRAASS